MPRNERMKSAECCSHYGKKKLLIGVFLFLLGLVKYMGYDWDMVLMVAGVLVFAKGILMLLKK